MFGKILRAIFDNDPDKKEESETLIAYSEENENNEADRLKIEFEEFKEYCIKHFKGKEKDSKQKVIKAIERAKEYANTEKSLAVDFAPEMGEDKRKYGDFLIISSQQFPDFKLWSEFSQEMNGHQPDDGVSHEIRLESISNVTVDDYQKNLFNIELRYSPLCYREYKPRLIHWEVEGLLKECINDENTSVTSRLEKHFRRTTFAGDTFSREPYYIYHANIIPNLYTTITIHTKFGKQFYINVSVFVVEKVLTAIDQIIKTGKYNPNKFIGEQ